MVATSNYVIDIELKIYALSQQQSSWGAERGEIDTTILIGKLTDRWDTGLLAMRRLRWENFFIAEILVVFDDLRTRPILK